MKKKLLCLLGIAAMALSLGACGSKKGGEGGGDDTPVTPAKQTFTVSFEVDGSRYATARVKDGEKITDEIETPSKVGYSFIGWYEGETLIDLSTYVVTHNVTLVAKFDKNDIPEYNVDDVKQADKTYYLVLGWWECEDPDDPEKKTSGLTKEHVRMFYHNMINYLKTVGATDEDIANISFRNYSTATVGEMGEKILADADVDIVIGVGNNINTMDTTKTGGRVPLYGATEALPGGDNSYKFSTQMGSKPNNPRYVACLNSASELGVETFSWLKETKAGPQAFLKVLTQEEINKSLVIDLTVTVHGVTEETTKLDDKEDVIVMPEINVPVAHVFKGFALTENGEVVLAAEPDAELKYADVKDLVADDATTLDLYPVFEPVPAQEKQVNIYIQVNGDYLTQPEAELLKARFLATLAADESAKIEIVKANANNFEAAVIAAGDADVLVGGGSPLDRFKAFGEGSLTNTGAKHFASTNRKVEILNSLDLKHYEFSKRFYSFVTAEAPEYELHTAFWGNEGNWVSAAEEATMKNGIVNTLNESFKLTGEKTLESVYNVKVTNADVAGSDVASLVTATKALREGKGADLVIGCDDGEDGLGAVAKKAAPVSKVSANRQVALVSNNPLAKEVYDKYFVAPTDVNLTVTIHGDVNVTTYLDEADEVIAMPLITVPSGYTFEGFATSETGAVALDVEKDAVLKYADVKDLVAIEATALDLYPVFEEIPTSIDLTVTVHGDGETSATTAIDDLDDVISMPTITIPDKKLFKGFATSADGEVVLNVAKDAVLKYNDVKDLVATDAKTLDLYPIFEDDPAQMFDLFVYVQINSGLTEAECGLLEARFNDSLTESKKVKFIPLKADKDTFNNAVTAGGDADVLIGAKNTAGTNSPFTAHENGPAHLAGAKHFKDAARYVMIKDSVATSHYDLAKALYDFVVADAVEFEVHVAYWPQGTKETDTWVTTEEQTTITAGIRTSLNTFLGITGEDTLEGIYNVKLTAVPVEASDKKVDTYATNTNALRDDKGTDIVVGCGGKHGSMVFVEKEALKTGLVAFSGRYAGLVRDNALTRYVFENYLTEKPAA